MKTPALEIIAKFEDLTSLERAILNKLATTLSQGESTDVTEGLVSEDIMGALQTGTPLFYLCEKQAKYGAALEGKESYRADDIVCINCKNEDEFVKVTDYLLNRGVVFDVSDGSVGFAKAAINEEMRKTILELTGESIPVGWRNLSYEELMSTYQEILKAEDKSKEALAHLTYTDKKGNVDWLADSHNPLYETLEAVSSEIDRRESIANLHKKNPVFDELKRVDPISYIHIMNGATSAESALTVNEATVMARLLLRMSLPESQEIKSIAGLTKQDVIDAIKTEHPLGELCIKQVEYGASLEGRDKDEVDDYFDACFFGCDEDSTGSYSDLINYCVKIAVPYHAEPDEQSATIATVALTADEYKTILNICESEPVAQVESSDMGI